MSGFDSLIGKSLIHIIKKNLGHSTLEKIENRVLRNLEQI